MDLVQAYYYRYRFRFLVVSMSVLYCSEPEPEPEPEGVAAVDLAEANQWLQRRAGDWWMRDGYNITRNGIEMMPHCLRHAVQSAPAPPPPPPPPPLLLRPPPPPPSLPMPEIVLGELEDF